MNKITKFAKDNFFLILILSLFLVSRLFRITEIPRSLYWDEASIGYNAYSVLTTSKDEWGEALPLHFRAFGEFKLPVYIYSVAIAEFFFGLSILAVRLPAVIYGMFSTIGLYLIAITITKNKKIALLASFLFSITPWFFIFSRTGYEVTAGIAFFLFGIYTLLISLEKRWVILISTIFFILSCYSYNSFRILTPLILGPAILYFLFKNRSKLLFISVIVLMISIVPIFKLYTKDSGLNRLQTVKDTKNIFSNYFKNFSYNFLFIIGDQNARSQIPGNSELFKLDIPFLIFGLYYILKKKNIKYFLPLILLILAPIPSAITKENPHALRSILMSPSLSLISAFGVHCFSIFFKRNKNLILVFVVFLYLLFFENYIYKFATEYNSLTSASWQSYYKDVIDKYSLEFSKFEKIYVSDKYAQPYIFFLFYNKFDPKEFIKTKQLNNISDWGFSTVSSFGKFYFVKNCDVGFDKRNLRFCQ